MKGCALPSLQENKVSLGVGEPEVGNGGGEDDPVGGEHVFSYSEVDITEFALAPDVFHLEDARY